MRENRPCGSEGGEGVSPFRPLSRTTSVVPLCGLGLGYGLLNAIALPHKRGREGGQTRSHEGDRQNVLFERGANLDLREPAFDIVDPGSLVGEAAKAIRHQRDRNIAH